MSNYSSRRIETRAGSCIDLLTSALYPVTGGENISSDQVAAASRDRGLWYGALRQAFAQYDFLVLPTAQVFPFDAELHWPNQIDGRSMDTYHRWMEIVIPGTLSGCPVVNVPAGFSGRGLPMGLQIIGKRYGDFATLQMAYAYEQASRWNLDRHPPILSSLLTKKNQSELSLAAC